MSFTDGTGEKIRPDLIISNNSLNSYADVIVLKMMKTFINDGYSFKLGDATTTKPMKQEASIRFSTIETISVHMFPIRKQIVY